MEPGYAQCRTCGGFLRLFPASNDLHATIAVTNSPRTAHRGPVVGLAPIRHGWLSHFGHEWVLLTNLLGVLLGFALLSKHFEASNVTAPVTPAS